MESNLRSIFFRWVGFQPPTSLFCLCFCSWIWWMQQMFLNKKTQFTQNGSFLSRSLVPPFFFSGCLGNKIQIAEEIGGNLTWYPPDDASEVTASWVFSVGGSELLYLPRAIGLLVWGFGVGFWDTQKNKHIPIHIPPSWIFLWRCFLLFPYGRGWSSTFFRFLYDHD